MYVFYTQWDGGYAYTSNRQPSEGCEPAVGQVSMHACFNCLAVC